MTVAKSLPHLLQKVRKLLIPKLFLSYSCIFKEKVSRKFGDFKVHCMMDEIGKLHPNNVKGILEFANCRNILLINSSPTTYNVEDYKYTYLLSKDAKSNTRVVSLLTRK